MNPWKISTFVLVAVMGIGIGWGQVGSTADAGEKQPHMRAALVNLRSAKAQLEKADDDKDGHRVKAIALAQEAIDEVQKGIDFDK